MKVLLVNGSPHTAGSTYTALHEMEQIFQANGIETELLQIGKQDIRGCVACNACSKLGKCAFSDLVNEVRRNLRRQTALSLEVRSIMHPQMRH